MSRKFKCPACSNKFEGELVDNRVECPYCGKRLRLPKENKDNKESKDEEVSAIEDSNNDILTVGNYFIISLIGIVFPINIIIYLLIILNKIFKNKKGYREYAKFQLIVMAIAFVFVVLCYIVMIKFGVNKLS